MKVKIIYSEDLGLGTEDMEPVINDFIKDKKVIDIKYVEYSDEDGTSARALIMYEED